MKSLPIVLVLLIMLAGCSTPNSGSGGNGTASNAVKTTPPPDPKVSQTSTPKPEATPSTASFTTLLKRAAGKYPYEIKLLDNAELKSRLEKLLGTDYPAMKQNFDVQGPIEIEDGIAMLSGCEAHNCGDNSYLMFVDLNADNINLFHHEIKGSKHYFEKDEIKLPRKFATRLKSDQ